MTADQCAATADHVEDGAELVRVKSCAVTTSDKRAPACAQEVEVVFFVTTLCGVYSTTFVAIRMRNDQ